MGSFFYALQKVQHIQVVLLLQKLSSPVVLLLQKLDFRLKRQ